jgi:hypothetical protein
MQRFSWLQQWIIGGLQTRRARAGKRTARFRPQLNMLERRELLSFSAPVAYTSVVPQALVTADVNGDGKLDLISLVDYGATIAVQLNNGNGSFGPAAWYYDGVSGGSMTALAVGDVTGDGKPDIVAAGYLGDDTFGVPAPISLLVGNGKGSFTLAGSSYALPDDSGITSLALADFNGDGNLELVAAAKSGAVYVISDLRSIAISYPVPVQTLNVPATGGPSWAAVGDFNGDGKPDIVVASGLAYMPEGSVSVLLNNGNGTFGAAQTYTVGGAPTSVAVGDFNRDGKLDIVTANSNSTMSVLLNNGDGTFGPAQNDGIGGPGNSVAVGDFDHDGYLDVVTTGTELDVLWGNGTGAFGAYQKVGPAGSSVVAADFNGDGFPDLAQIDANVSSDLGSIDVVLNDAYWMVGPVSLSFGTITYNSTKKVYSETVTLTNNTSGPLTGSLSLELTNLPSGVVLTDASGTTNGNPYIRFLNSGKTLKKGASVTITLTFTAPSSSDITFGTEVVVL